MTASVETVGDVAVVDIPGAYLSADMDDEVYVVFRGTLSDLMVTADPALYWPLVSYETGQAVLYARLHKALYGCLKRRTSILREVSGRSGGVWVQDKYIRPVCGQQYDRRETSNSMLARGRPQDIMPIFERGDKNDTTAKVRIWINERIELERGTIYLIM